MNNLNKTYDIPSKKMELLSKIRGLVLVDMIRYSWWSLSDSIKECNIKESDVFSLTAGPIELCFSSGLTIGGTSDPSKNSVLIWQESFDNGQPAVEDLMRKDKEIHPIFAKDQGDWCNMLGGKIDKYYIISREPVNSIMAELANEVGLLIKLDNGYGFILSHGLHDVSDDFSVIKKDNISKKINDELMYKELFI